MCDCEPGKIYQETIRKAAKIHYCCECGNAILPGTLYCNVSVLQDSWGNFKICNDCKKVADYYELNSDCGYPLGGLFNELHECEMVLYSRKTKSFVSNDSYLEIINGKVRVKEQQNV